MNDDLVAIHCGDCDGTFYVEIYLVDKIKACPFCKVLSLGIEKQND